MQKISYCTSVADLCTEQLTGFWVDWPNPPSPAIHLQLLQQSNYRVVAIDNKSKNIVGFVTAISDGVLSAYIPFLEVLPAYQGRGIGKELMQRMLAQLKHLYMIDLVCDEELKTFYQPLGMQAGTAMLHRNYERQSGKAIIE